MFECWGDQEQFQEYYEMGFVPWDCARASKELLKFLNEGKLPGKTVLEFGCGSGDNAIEFARRGYEVSAWDFIQLPITQAIAKAKAAKVDVDFQVRDICSDQLKQPYDILFDRAVYHHIRHVNLAAFQKQLIQVSRPGTLWLSLTARKEENRGNSGTPPVTEEEILSELGPLFEIIELLPCYQEPNFAGEDGEFYANCPPYWAILMRRKEPSLNPQE